MELRGTLLFLQNKQKNLYLGHRIGFNVGTGSCKSAARLIKDGGRDGQWDLNPMGFVSRDTNPGTWDRDWD